MDLATLPGGGGGATGPYQVPALPVTTRTVTISTSGNQARQDIAAACATPGTHVVVPDAAGSFGTLDLGNVQDCDVELGPQVVMNLLFVGHLPGPTVAPVQRVRVRGGQTGGLIVDPGSTDVVVDGMIINNGVVPSSQRSYTGVLLNSDDLAGTYVNRFALLRSMVRLVPSPPDGGGNRDGTGFLGARARNVLFAGNNIVTSGNRNSWGFRIGGGDNYIIHGNVTRVSFHKLIRMNDGPVDYVYVKDGIWMREATLTAGGLSINDSFQQLGDLGTDHVYIHDTAVHLLSSDAVGFGATTGPGQVGKSWEARRIHWFARSASVVSDALLTGYQNGCASGALCDYGVGTHTYSYAEPLVLPTNAWLNLPGISEDNPDNQPTAP